MTILWLTAFLDFPSSTFASGTTFWQAATSSDLSPPRGIFGEFATLLPDSGDAYVRAQRIEEGPAHCHLDLHVEDIAFQAERAERLGALVLRQGKGITTMRSPGGLDFCVVAHHGEHERPAPVLWPDGHRSVLDQVCVDVAPDGFNAEVTFWAELSQWPRHQGSREEFAYLPRAEGVALRLLFQRVQDTSKLRASAHLDFASDDVASEVQRHEALGASVERVMTDWTTMRDPAGLAYCITRRRPDTGTL